MMRIATTTRLAVALFAALLVATSATAAATLVQPSFAQTAETKGDAWNSINTALGDIEKAIAPGQDTPALIAKLDGAKAKYDSAFREAAHERDAETGERVDTAFADFRAAVESGSKIDVTINKQIIDKNIYKIAFMKIEEELLEEKVDEAAEWFAVMTKKFKYDESPSGASTAMAELQAEPERVGELAPVILDGLRAQFVLKVKEEITETVGALSKQPADTAAAQKLAVEGISYYRTIQPDVKAKLGEDVEGELFHELEELFVAARAGDLEGAEHAGQEAEALLAQYEGKETEGAAAAVGKLVDLLTLVDEEYGAAVENGQIINQEEYDEAVLFAERATETFNDAKADLASVSEVSAAAVADFEADLEVLSGMIQDKADPAEVAEFVEHMILDLQRDFGAGSAAATEMDGWAYIDRIGELLDSAVQEYEEGNFEDARNIAREAYLDNYEFIETDIAEEDPELMAKIELDMREELVSMMDDRRPLEEVQAHVDQIKADLEVARAVVTPEFPVAALAASVGIAGTIAYGRLRGFGLLRRRA